MYSDGDSEGGAPVITYRNDATGIPVISPNHCDIPMIMLIYGMNNWLVGERNINALVMKIKMANSTCRRMANHAEYW